MHTAGCHVGGHQDLGRTFGEGGQVAVTGVLAQVAVQVHGRNPGFGQPQGHLLGVVLGAHEHDAPAGPAGQGAHQFLLLIGTHDEHVVFHGVHGSLRGIDGVHGRIMQVALDHLVHPVVQGGGKQQVLDTGRGAVKDPAHHRQEAHIGHVISLIQHRDLDQGQVNELLLHQVIEAARAGDDDIHAVIQGLFLAALGDSTVDHGGAQSGGFRERFGGLGDLGGQFTGGGHDQCAGEPGLAALRVGGQAGDHRDGEGQGLARAGLPATQDVPTGQGGGKGGFLDREGAADPLRLQDGYQLFGHAKGAKSFSHGRTSSSRACTPILGAPGRRKLEKVRSRARSRFWFGLCTRGRAGAKAPRPEGNLCQSTHAVIRAAAGDPRPAGVAH